QLDRAAHGDGYVAGRDRQRCHVRRFSRAAAADGVGLNGVLIRRPSCALLPAEARVTSCTCTGSPGASGAPPIAATAASMLGQRFAGSFSSIRITAVARPAATSGRMPVIGGGGSWKWAYMIAMTETAVNGRRPVSIS